MGLPEKTLQRIQLWIAILAGAVTLFLGAYNMKNIFFPKPKEEVSSPTTPFRNSDPIRSAVEDVGAEWIKKLGKPTSPPTGQ